MPSHCLFRDHIFCALHAQLKTRPEKRKSLISPPNITVQIPTYNEIAALNCAERCLKFEYPKEHLQIIIGDDSDDPLISKRIDEFASLNSQIEISRRGTNNGYKPGNLNAMLKKSRGDYILIFDSDFLPKRDFLAKL